MNFHIITTCIFVLIVSSFTTNYALGQIDPLTEIEFLQSGSIYSDKNEFNISNDIDIREFFNGNIIRVSGQTIEGFPYITYSKVSDENIDTHGIIFIDNQFVKLSFDKKSIQVEEIIDKMDDLTLAVQYTQRAHSKQFISIDVKVFEKEQNYYSNYNQNYGYIPNTNINIIITDKENNEIFSSIGITNDKGSFETKYMIPDNSKRETLTITINAEDENSSSTKILQTFALGNIPADGGP
ncbi:MAG: hypothetical protein ISR81_02990 [Nitrosopumilus sp.]|nr:hypothetical protein [Nitrosopumilus sp.]MBL7017863.1 hypothetical protein [Nitrosopumilus sp.]